MSLSLDDTKIHFQLRDTELITKSCYFEKNILFSHLAEKDYKINVDLTLNDFLPIFHHISKSKKPSRGEVEEFDKFFDFCQYIGEIELPILVTKDCDLIQRWHMKTEDLIISEKERLILKMYVDMDNNNRNHIKKYLDEYMDDKYNNKLNEKTRGHLFKSLNELLINQVIIHSLGEIKEEEEDDYYQMVKGYPWHPVYYQDIGPITHKYKHVKIAIVNLKLKFDEFPWTHENGKDCLFVAGGCVVKNLMKDQTCFHGSDYGSFVHVMNIL